MAYYASAEIGCHLALGWPIPTNVLDLYVEFRNLTNGLRLPCGRGLVGAMTHFGFDSMNAIEKDGMRDLAIRGGPWTDTERADLLDYCESDVVALNRLLPAMAPSIDLPRALLRGRYMAAASRIEHVGVPIDHPTLTTLTRHWPDIQRVLIQRIDRDYGVFDDRTFKRNRWEAWLTVKDIPWPRLDSGGLALDDDTFKQMSRQYPEIEPLRQLRVSLGEMRLADLSVGSDGRNRCLLSAFQSRTGRNQPSNSQFIFGPAVWLRGLIRPEPGWGLAYIDWGQQEFGIAAALSGDANMIAAYESRDPYLAFGKQSGAVPLDASKDTHGPQREQFKACVLAVQYGMGPDSLAARIGCPTAQAKALLQKHHDTYRHFWRWSDAAVDHANLHLHLNTVFGWTLHIDERANHRSQRNFPVQGNGAEMLRLACCFATERGIRVCAPIHDAILIEAPLNELDDTVEQTQQALGEASKIVLDGFQLRSEAKKIRYPERYMDDRGERMWGTVTGIVREIDPGTTCA